MISRIRRAPVFAAFALMTAAPAPAAAHPHLWIDVSAVVVFDAERRVTAIETRWRFDELYSVFATDGLDADGDGAFSSQELAGLAAENVKQLKEWGYFSVVESGGKQVPLASVTDYAMTWGDGRLTMDMTLRPAKSVDPVEKPFRFTFFDPTYYIDLVFARDEPLRLIDPPAGCRARVDASEGGSGTVIPDEVATAVPVDPNKPLQSLGARFAEWVSLDCAGAKP